MGRLINSGHFDRKDLQRTLISREQKALDRLILVLRNSLDCQAKALVTPINSSLFNYFQTHHPPYQILKDSQTAIFPIFIEKRQLWGLLQVQSPLLPLAKAQIDKILNSIQSTLLPHLSLRPYTTTQENAFFLSHLHLFLSCQQHNDAIKVALDILERSHKSHLIHWECLDSKPKRIRDLHELPEVLIFIEEILCLSPQQRRLIALYLDLPLKLQGAQIIASSSCKYSELKSLICKEILFLNTLKKHKYHLSEIYLPSKKDKILQNITSTFTKSKDFDLSVE